MPSNFWEIEDDLESGNFSSPGQYKLFPSREVFAGGSAGTMCHTQPASSRQFWRGNGEAMEMKMFPLPCPLLHPISPFPAVPTGQMSTRLEFPRLSTWHVLPGPNTLESKYKGRSPEDGDNNRWEGWGRADLEPRCSQRSCSSTAGTGAFPASGAG